MAVIVVTITKFLVMEVTVMAVITTAVITIAVTVVMETTGAIVARAIRSKTKRMCFMISSPMATVTVTVTVMVMVTAIVIITKRRTFHIPMDLATYTLSTPVGMVHLINKE